MKNSHLEMFKKLLTLILMLAIGSNSYSQCSDLFFSEYIEGSGANKALEIYNPRGTAIDLGDYEVWRFNNGGTSPIDIQGWPANTMINPNDIYVIGNPSGNASILAASDTTSSITFYNGDDALALINISTGDTLDIIGEIGVDPGSGWPIGTGATNNFTFIRQISIQSGQLDWTIGATEWDVYPMNMTDSLGMHHMAQSGSSVSEIACESYTWIDGNTYTTSTTVMDTLTNVVGCDSIITLNLTINNSTTGIDVQVACGSFTWIDGNTYTSSNTTAMDTIPNAAGCDSIITLDLTINTSTTGTDVQVACDSFTWIDGNTYTSSNTTAMDTIPNVAGCDSIITLDLTINVLTATVVDNGNGSATSSATGGTVAGAYTFLWDASAGGQTTATATGLTSGTYCATITDDNGCSDTACVTILITGLQDVSSQVGNFKVYPNPTTGNVFVELDLDTQADVQLDIYNTTGQNVMTRQLNGQADRIELNIGELPAGVYLMRFAVENEVTTKKLILQR